MKQICKKSAAGRCRLLLILLLSGLTAGCGSGQMVEVTGIQDLPTHPVRSTEHEAAAEGAAAAADSVTAATDSTAAEDKEAAADSVAEAADTAAAAAGRAPVPDSAASDNMQVTAAKIVVYVRGAVNRPGVYQLEENARIFRAIEAAGGFRGDADTEWLNQAQPLFDGAMLTVPTREETAILRQAGHTDSSGGLISGSKGLTDSQGTAIGISQGGTSSAASGQVPEKNGTGSPASTGNDGEARVNLNTAQREELMTLPGIGESKADSIIRYREEHGAFTTPEEIMNISGIKSAVYSKIQDRITV
ncbi:helix-hairpin-helix domain-containing protein [Porcincola intestinalis]|uniref:helix-hairpin-helix domain-containing protein n=1 Tax=Porcincola intestinalis TaxID=2606632 RepID=UPI002A91CAC2|nr:helix-hairpin-helix domain-containing protein [Porcincola intestinalis]MDY5579104.1 helix-hairpin-helix domain-containing protein [Porcincola intestinalis]